MKITHSLYKDLGSESTGDEDSLCDTPDLDDLSDSLSVTSDSTAQNGVEDDLDDEEDGIERKRRKITNGVEDLSTKKSELREKFVIKSEPLIVN